MNVKIVLLAVFVICAQLNASNAEEPVDEVKMICSVRLDLPKQAGCIFGAIRFQALPGKVLAPPSPL